MKVTGIINHSLGETCVRPGILTSILMLLVLSSRTFTVEDQSDLLDRGFFERMVAMQTMNSYTNSSVEEIEEKYPGAWVDQTPKYKVRYIYVPDPANQRQYLSFRWTANLMNAWIDINIRRVYDPALDIYVHKGVNLAAREVMGRVIPKLNPEHDLIITGHSMGGSIAVVLAMHLFKAGYPLEEVVSFGQFRITNRSGARKWKNLPYIRVAAKWDFVTWLPPSFLTGYHHFGKNLKLVGSSGYRFLIPGTNNMLDNTAEAHPVEALESWEKIKEVVDQWEEGEELPDPESVWGPGHDLDNYIRKLSRIAASLPESISSSPGLDPDLRFLYTQVTK
jgi:hypothetical protein